jgi:hypothetical protein
LIGKSIHVRVLDATREFIVRVRPGGGFDKYRFEIHGTIAGE